MGSIDLGGSASYDYSYSSRPKRTASPLMIDQLRKSRAHDERKRGEVSRLKQEVQQLQGLVRQLTTELESSKEKQELSLLANAPPNEAAVRMRDLLQEKNATIDSQQRLLELKETQLVNKEHQIDVLMGDLDDAEEQVDKLLTVKDKAEAHSHQLEEEIEDLQHARLDDVTVLKDKQATIDRLANELKLAHHQLGKSNAIQTSLQTQLAETRATVGVANRPSDISQKLHHDRLLNSLELENQKLSAELDATLKDLQAVTEQLRDKDSAVVELHYQLTENAKSIDHLHAEQHQHVRELEDYMGQMEEMQQIIRNREDELRVRHTEITNLHHKLVSLEAAVSESKSKLHDKEHFITELSRRERSTLYSTDELTQKIMTKDEVITELNLKLQQHKAEIAVLTEQLDVNKEMGIETQKERQTLQTLKTELELKQDGYHKELDEKNNQITFLKDTVEFLEGHVRQFIQEAKDKDMDLQKKTDIIDQLESTCDIVSSNYLRRDEAVRDLQTEAHENSTRITFLEEERERLLHQSSMDRSAAKALRKENEGQAERIREMLLELEEFRRKAAIQEEVNHLKQQNDESSQQRKRVALLTAELEENQRRIDQSQRDNVVLQQHISTLQKELEKKDRELAQMDGNIKSLEQLQLLRDNAPIYQVKTALARDISVLDNDKMSDTLSSTSGRSERGNNNKLQKVDRATLNNIRTRLVQTEMLIKKFTAKLSGIVEEHSLLDGSVDPKTVPLSELLNVVLLHFETSTTISKQKLKTANQEVNEVAYASSKFHQLAEVLSFKTHKTTALTTTQISTLIDAMIDRINNLITSHKSKDAEIKGLKERVEQQDDDLLLASKLQTRAVDIKHHKGTLGWDRTNFVDDYWDSFKHVKTVEAHVAALESKVQRLRGNMDSDTHTTISNSVAGVGVQTFNLRQKMSKIIEKYFDEEDRTRVGASIQQAIQQREQHGQHLRTHSRTSSGSSTSSSSASSKLTSGSSHQRRRMVVDVKNRKTGSNMSSMPTDEFATFNEEIKAIAAKHPPPPKAPASSTSSARAPPPAPGGPSNKVIEQPSFDTSAAVGRTEAWIASAAHPASAEMSDTFKLERQARHRRNLERRAKKDAKRPGASVTQALNQHVSI